MTLIESIMPNQVAVPTHGSFASSMSHDWSALLASAAEEPMSGLKPCPTRDELAEQIRNELRSGKIPEVVRDELRICPLDSEAGIKFQTAMEALARRFSKHWGIEKHPVRFFLMDAPGMNACQIRDADPPLIGFTRGCFVSLPDKKGAFKECMQYVDEVAEYLAHEGVHLVIEGRYSAKSPTKGEEGIALGASVEVLHDAGFDARKTMSAAEKRLKNSGDRINWANIVDEHPTPSTTVSLFQAALTRLTKQRGEINIPPTLLKPDDPLVEAAREASHTSSLESFLKAQSYESLSSAQKLHVLAEFVSGTSYLSGQRLADVRSKLRDIRFVSEVLSVEEKDAVDLMANCILDLPLRSNCTASERLIYSLSALVHPGIEIMPLGRLQPIAQACFDFVNAKDLASAMESAEALIQACQREPLFSSKEGIKTLHVVSLPQFAYPDIPEPGHGKSTKGVPVSWNQHVKWVQANYDATTDDPILTGLLLLGVDDPRLHAYLTPEVAARFLSDRRARLCQGPHSGSHTLDDLFIDSAGRAALSPKTDDASRRVLRRLNRNKQVLCEMADKLFAALTSNSDPKAKEQLKLLAKAITELKTRIMLGGAEVQGRVTSTRSFSLVGLNQLHRDPALFVEINGDDLCYLPEQVAIRERFTALRKTDPVAHRSVIREFFDACMPAGTTYQRFDFCPVMVSSTPMASLRASPVLNYLVSDDNAEFSPREKLDIIHACTNWSNVTLEYAKGHKDRADALTKSFLDSLRPLLSLAMPGWKKPTCWEDLAALASRKDFTSLAIATPYLELECLAMISNSKARLSLKQMVPILEMLKGVTTHHLTETGKVVSQHIFRAFTPMVSKGIRWNRDLKTALNEWKVLLAAGLLPANKVYSHLEDLITKVEQTSTCNLRTELFESLICDRKVRIMDPGLRGRAIDGWAQSIRQMHGVDNGLPEYRSRILQIAKRIEDGVSDLDNYQIFDSLAKATQAQHELSRELKAYTNPISARKLQESNAILMGGEAAAAVMYQKENVRRAALEFLISPFDSDSLEKFNQVVEDEVEFSTVQGDVALGRPRRLENLRLFYKNFWSAPLELRTLLARELLIPPALTDAKQVDEAFNYALSRTFPEEQEYSAEARELVRAYLDVIPDYASPLVLTALMVAAERAAELKKGTGFALASFLEAMGPAETKAGQAAQSHPKTPKTIRDDLARLKTMADEPARWEVTELVETLVPDETRKRISHIGDVLGSASLYIAVEVQMQDGSAQVLSLLRPHALERAQFGFKIMADMAQRLGQTNPAFNTLIELVHDARTLVDYETNTRLAAQQRLNAKAIYDGVGVSVDGQEFSFQAPSLNEYGDAYFLSDKVPGSHFIDLKEDSPARTALAKAILTLELNNVLSGHPFDNDRHGGNCRIQGGMVGHFDFGGMLLEPPSTDDLRDLARCVVRAISECSNIGEFADKYFVELKRSAECGSPVNPFLRRVQKALLSLGEYMQALSPQDLEQVLVSALQDVHPAIRETAMQEVTVLVASGKHFPAALISLASKNGGKPPILITRTGGGHADTPTRDAGPEALLG